MSEDEFREPHVRAVFQLLVMQHDAYSGFEIIDDQLAMAQKSGMQLERKQLLINTRL